MYNARYGTSSARTRFSKTPAIHGVTYLVMAVNISNVNRPRTKDTRTVKPDIASLCGDVNDLIKNADIVRFVKAKEWLGWVT